MRTVQDALRGPLVLDPAVDVVLVTVAGDGNAVGADTITVDWTGYVSDLPDEVDVGVPDDCHVWNKWTIGDSVDRYSDEDTGDGWHNADAGLVDHGVDDFRGTGEAPTSNGPETSFAFGLRKALRLYSLSANVPVYVAKLGVAGSVVHGAPSADELGWAPPGAATGPFNVLTTGYLAPAIIKLLGDEKRIWYGGTLWIAPATDAIDPDSAEAEPVDALNVDGYTDAVLRGIHEFLGLERPPAVIVLPPTTFELAPADAGYPRMEAVRAQLRDLASRRTARGHRTLVVDPAGLQRGTDYLHLKSQAQWVLGRMAAEALISAPLRLERILDAP